MIFRENEGIGINIGVGDLERVLHFQIITGTHEAINSDRRKYNWSRHASTYLIFDAFSLSCCVGFKKRKLTNRADHVLCAAIVPCTV